jgi:Leu/Phe-tRNA-protein transferase
MNIKYTSSGYIFISSEDDCNEIVDIMLETGYSEEFCIANDFNTEFIARLMEAGFLVMSMNLAVYDMEKRIPDNYILLPKLHLVRSVLFFENLHIKKSIRRQLDCYELKPDVEFERIIDRCVEKHGDGWLTPPLVECIKKIRYQRRISSVKSGKAAYPSSFGLYREGKLVSGEFGVICGKVYTGYSCFYDEDNAGSIRFVLTTRYLQQHGFNFFDLGMPMDYKTSLGALDIFPEDFVKLFRK